MAQTAFPVAARICRAGPPTRNFSSSTSLRRRSASRKPLVTRPQHHRGRDAARPARLREHYEQKLARYRLPRRSGADELLLKVFTTAPRTRAAPKAASVLREMRIPLRQQILRSGRIQRIPGASGAALDDRAL